MKINNRGEWWEQFCKDVNYLYFELIILPHNERSETKFVNMITMEFLKEKYSFPGLFKLLEKNQTEVYMNINHSELYASEVDFNKSMDGLVTRVLKSYQDGKDPTKIAMYTYYDGLATLIKGIEEKFAESENQQKQNECNELQDPDPVLPDLVPALSSTLQLPYLQLVENNTTTNSVPFSPVPWWPSASLFLTVSLADDEWDEIYNLELEEAVI